MEKVPFINHSLRALCRNLGCEQADDDVRKPMELFKELGASNPQFTYRVQADGEDRIKCLMWMNGSSRLQQASERFTGEMNPRALGWTQRYAHSVLQIQEKGNDWCGCAKDTLS